jgi:hypothetical protein
VGSCYRSSRAAEGDLKLIIALKHTHGSAYEGDLVVAVSQGETRRKEGEWKDRMRAP